MNPPLATSAAPGARRLAGLRATTAELQLPDVVDFPVAPERVLQLPVATTADVLDDVVFGWLAEKIARSPKTAETYCSCMAVYLPWCSAERVDPLLITRPQASRFAQWLASMPSATTSRVRSPARRAQILAACTSLLEYAIEADARPGWVPNPFARVPRPVIDRHPKHTGAVTVSQVNQVVLAARGDRVLGSVLGKLVVALMARLGLRPGDVCRLNLSGAEDDGHGGYRLQVRVKGGRWLPRWLPPDMASDFWTYAHRVRVQPASGDDVPADPLGDDPLFVHPRLQRRLCTDDVRALVRRASAAAGVRHPAGRQMTSRDFRPFFNTLARSMGATLEERQRGLGHASATTTELYDRTEWARTRDPAIRVSAAFDDYPAESRLAPITITRWSAPPVQMGCDCTPQWPQLHVDLTPVGVDQTAVCVITEAPEPGTHRLQPYCRRCRVAYPGFFRVARVLDDAEGRWLDEARAGLTEAARFPEAVDRRDERRRRDELGDTGAAGD